MFIDMAFGSPIYERLPALGFNNVFETNFGLTHTPDRGKANMQDQIRIGSCTARSTTTRNSRWTWRVPDIYISRSNLLVLESKADMQKRGQASPDDGDALALTFAQPVVPAEVEESDEDEEFGRECGGYTGGSRSGWMR